MNAAELAELESEKARRERAKKAVEAREWHPVKKPISEATPSPKIEPTPPKQRVRATVAKSAGVSERKVRQAQEVKKAALDGSPGNPDNFCGVLCGFTRSIR